MSLLSVYSISALAESWNINFFCYLFCVNTVEVKSHVLSSGKINPAGYKATKAQSFVKAMGFKLKYVGLGFGCLLVNL